MISDGEITPIVYKFPDKPNKPIKLIDIIFDDEPAPKLLKYGFNQMIEKLDLASIISNPHYKAGLNYNFDRHDILSIQTKCKKIFGLDKDINDAELKLFCTYWEILNIFSLLDKNPSILTNQIDIFKNIETTHKKIFKSKLKISYDKFDSKDTSDLIFRSYSKIDIDENAWIHLVLNELPTLLQHQTKGANMVIQLFEMQTDVTVELIYYLGTLYQEMYIMKPLVVSNLSNEKYLVLINLIADVSKQKFPKISPDIYVSQLDIDNSVPETVINIVQCINSELVPVKLQTYNEIKKYLGTNVFEGITYDEMILDQNMYTDVWIDIFTNKKNMEEILDKNIKLTVTKCDHVTEWKNLF